MACVRPQTPVAAGPGNNADTSTSSAAFSSDLELAVSSIRRTAGLIGYRNVFSYTAALGIKTFSDQAFDTDSWVRLGSGAYSTTYSGLLNGQTAAAIKQPSVSFSRADSDLETEVQHDGLRSIVQELRILSHERLRDHPNLPHVIGVFFQEDGPVSVRPCVIFDLATSDLHKHLVAHRTSKLNPGEMLNLLSGVAHGIAVLHTYNIVHGDIKPDNILLFMRDGKLTAAVGDLGSSGTATASEDVIKGTLWYCAPEYHRQSYHAAHANRPSRDVYSFGLLVWSSITYCKSKPFPPETQLEIQHQDDLALQHLLAQTTPETLAPGYEDLMRRCLRCDPLDRPTIFDVCTMLTPQREASLLQAAVLSTEAALLEDPESPRVKTLGEVSLPAHLIGKLRYEYANAADTKGAIRNALTLAGLYSGAIGTALPAPWNTVAKIQWLSKAIELGSHAAVQGIIVDVNAVKCVEEFGVALLEIRRVDFSSPSVEHAALRRQLREFAEMPDEAAANLCVFYGGTLDWDKFGRLIRGLQEPDRDQVASEVHLTSDAEVPEDQDQGRTDGFTTSSLESGSDANGGTQSLDATDEAMQNDDDENLTHDGFAGLRHLARFAPNRHADLEVTDSDAYDLTFVNASPLSRSNFYNQLEDFMALAEQARLGENGEVARTQMSEAIFHGSFDIVRYLVFHYGVRPNDEWEGMSHVNHAVVFRRTAVVQFFLEHGATIGPATGDRLSALHLVSRHDDPHLTRMLCEHLQKHGGLRDVLDSATVRGHLKGWTVAYTAVTSGSWRNAEVVLEFGANPNAAVPEDDDCASLLELVVVPRSPATPLSTLKCLLRNGAVPNIGLEYSGSPLRWAVGSSNVLVVLELLVSGAVVTVDAVKDAEDDVDENEQMERAGKALEVVDEDGRHCDSGWQSMLTAARLVKTLLRVTSARQGVAGQSQRNERAAPDDWKRELIAEVEAADEVCKGKMWIRDSRKPRYLIQVQMPVEA